MTLTVERPFQIAAANAAPDRQVATALAASPQSTPRPARPTAPEPAGRVPRITRLMALAIKLDAYVRDGLVHDYAELARLGHVTRARITQIMDLNLLAPGIQEAILNLLRTIRGRDPIRERHVRPIAAEADWASQRSMWQRATQDSSYRALRRSGEV